jgi:hypothetical protein
MTDSADRAKNGRDSLPEFLYGHVDGLTHLDQERCSPGHQASTSRQK